MKQIMIRYSDNKPLDVQMEEISREYNKGTWTGLLFHLYSAFPKEKELVLLCKEIRKLFPSCEIAGTMSAGEIMEGRLMEDGTLISALLFETSAIQVFRLDGVKGNEIQIGREVCRILDGVSNIAGAELMFPGTSMNTQFMYEEISKCRPEIHIFGGYPGGHKLNSPEHFIFNDDEVMYDSLLLIAYIGKDLHINVDKTIGWEALGFPFKVTKAAGNHLIELNGRPAAEVYEKFLQIDRKVHNNAEESFEFMGIGLVQQSTRCSDSP